MSYKDNLRKFHGVITEIVGHLSLEEIQTFMDIFQNKLEELRNEQETNLQKNLGAP